MKRYLALILFVIVLVTPLLISWRISGRAVVTHSGDDLELVIITPHQEGIRREFADAFSAWHKEHFGKGVFISYLSFGSSDIVKYFDASRDAFKRQGTYKIDLVWGGGDVVIEEQLKRDRKRNVANGCLEQINLNPDLVKAVFPQSRLGGLPLYDQDPPDSGYWYGTALASFGIVYNRDVLKHLGLPEPKTWRDLADPRYRGWLILADPTRSAAAKQAYMVIVERAMADAKAQGRSEDDGWADGMGLLRQIMANARMWVDASSVVPIMISSGDGAAGTAIDFYGRSQMDAIAADRVGGNRMGYVEPENATIVNPDPIALVRGAEHKELALRFIDFVLSIQGQRLWNTKPGLPGGPRQTALRRMPIRQDVYQYINDFTDQVNPYKIVSTFNKSLAREKTFAIIGELLQFSGLDLMDELCSTRQAILASPRRAELDARLGRFPFDQKEALRRLDEWRQATPARKLQLQRTWTDQFNQEYLELKKLAS